MSGPVSESILFTGGGGAGTELLYRLLGERYRLHFADADPAAIHPRIPPAIRHGIPLADEPEFAQAILELCRREAVSMLVPAVDEELPRMVEVQAGMPGLVSAKLSRLSDPVAREYSWRFRLSDPKTRNRFVAWHQNDDLESCPPDEHVPTAEQVRRWVEDG